AHVVDDAAAGLLHHVGGVALKGVAEGVVGREKEPVLATGIHHGGAGAARQCCGVVGVVHGVGGALGVGQVGSCRTHGDEGALLFGGHAGHGQCGTGVGTADQHVDLLFVEPFAGARRGDIGLVLVVGDEQFDLLAVDLATHVLNGHADRVAAGRTVDIGVDPRHVGD